MWAMAAEIEGDEIWIWFDAAAIVPDFAAATKYSICLRETLFSMEQGEGRMNSRHLIRSTAETA
jgi:hypothetical protein